MRLLYATGLRYGEANALTIGDIDLPGRRKSHEGMKRTGPSSWAVGEPMTPWSRSTLSLSPELCERLSPAVDRLEVGAPAVSHPFGRRLPHAEVSERGRTPAVPAPTSVNPLGAAAGRPPPVGPRLPQPCDCAGVLGRVLRIHDLPTPQIALLSEGIRLEVISHRLGHSSITVTCDRYGHLDPVGDVEVSAAVNRSFARR